MSKERQSYSEQMKAAAMKKQGEKKGFMLDLYISMFWRKAWLDYRCSKLDEKIDKALDQRNKERFNELAREKNKLMKLYGT
ncbi:MAG TPA: IDEAL domain-containing protein [Chondromyces sp.]|nr:IDEAL domain-containing protein [Chondromyces sp.]